MKKKHWLYAGVGVLFFLLILFFSNNEFVYRTSIVQITQIQTISLGTAEGVNGKTEEKYKQEMTGVVQNGIYQGKEVTFSNQYKQSEVLTQKYKTGDDLFVQIREGEDSALIVTTKNVKRDLYFAVLFVVFFVSLFLISGKRGMLVIMALLTNGFLFLILLDGTSTETFFDSTWIYLSLLLCTITLFCAGGFYKKTIGAIISSAITMGLILILYDITIFKTDTLPYEMLPNIWAKLPLREIYRASVILGSLGAIMDVSITIQSSVSELLEKEKQLSMKELVLSIREIGYDIMGTMTNVLLFSYLSSSLPFTVLQVAGGYSIFSIFQYSYIFDIVRFLIGSISIVLAILVSGVIAVLIQKKGYRWSS